jgi:hypothetical protein
MGTPSSTGNALSTYLDLRAHLFCLRIQMPIQCAEAARNLICNTWITGSE